MNITPNEENIILFLREARPFEKIIIQKDAQGRPDNYIVIREQKVIMTTKSYPHSLDLTL